MANSNHPTIQRQIVAYYRLSTQIQGIDGLGMEAQRRSVEEYARQQHSNILASYAEVETGRKQTLRNRPELVRAIAHARRSGATLAIARLDRLARNLYVTAQLLESGVDFVACDNPHANRLTIQILAAMAEHEGRLISERCKATAAALKARGVKFGRKVGWKVPKEKAKYYASLSAASRRANVIDAYADLIPTIIRLRYVPTSLAGIAQHLNELGHCSQQKTPFSADVIRYALRRAGFGNLTARPRDLYGAKGLEIARAALAVANRKWDNECSAAVMPIVRKMRAEPRSYSAICDRLTKLGYRTRRGSAYRVDTLRRLLDRCGFEEAPEERDRLWPILVGRGVAEAAKRRRAASPGLLRLAKRLEKTQRTWGEIADELNARGFLTLTGTLWSAPSVRAMLERDRHRCPP